MILMENFFMVTTKIAFLSLIIFGVASSTHYTNKRNNVLMLGDSFTQSINGTTTYAERMYKTDPSILEKMYVMSVYYNGSESYLFINGTQELKFTAASTANLGNNTFCVGYISDEFSTENMEKTSLCKNIYDLSIDYRPHSVSKIYDTQIFHEKK